LTDAHVAAVLNEQAGTGGDLFHDLFGSVIGGDDDLASAVGVLDRDAAGHFGDRGFTLRGAGLEQFGHTGPTLGDVWRFGRGDTTGVEGAHRELGSALTDRLGGDDPDRFTDDDELAGGQARAVARGTGTHARLAVEHG